MSALIPFQFEGQSIRVVTDEAGEPMFVGKDICEALGYANSNKAMGDHCRGVTKRYPIVDALGRTQEARVLSEPDVLRLIINCNLPAAQAFERLVFEEILPTIRKTGSYTAPSAPAAPTRRPAEITTEALKLVPLAVRAARAFGLDKNAAAISANQLVHKVTGQNLLQDFGSTHLIAENQEAQYFTPTELGKRIAATGQKFNAMLSDAGMQIKAGSAWEATDKGKQFARIYDTGKKHESGVPVQQVKWAATVIEMLRPALPAPDQASLGGM